MSAAPASAFAGLMIATVRLCSEPYFAEHNTEYYAWSVIALQVAGGLYLHRKLLPWTPAVVTYYAFYTISHLDRALLHHNIPQLDPAVFLKPVPQKPAPPTPQPQRSNWWPW